MHRRQTLDTWQCMYVTISGKMCTNKCNFTFQAELLNPWMQRPQTPFQGSGARLYEYVKRCIHAYMYIPPPTGSWWCCVSLEVVSSMAAESTIIYRFFCGCICVSLCQSIKLKPTSIYHHMDFARCYNVPESCTTFKVPTYFSRAMSFVTCYTFHCAVPCYL